MPLGGTRPVYASFEEVGNLMFSPLSAIYEPDPENGRMIMGLFEAKASAKGQVTVPVEIRRALGLEGAGKLQFRMMPDGRVELRAKKHGLSHIKGLFAQPARRIDDDAEIMAEVWERNRPKSPADRR
jgi:AbrB family looped-hinge helix DNA binding protein